MIPTDRFYINQRSPQLLLGDRWSSHTHIAPPNTYTICSYIDTARSHLTIHARPLTRLNCKSLNKMCFLFFFFFCFSPPREMFTRCRILRPIKTENGRNEVQGCAERKNRGRCKPIFCRMLDGVSSENKSAGCDNGVCQQPRL